MLPEAYLTMTVLSLFSTSLEIEKEKERKTSQAIGCLVRSRRRFFFFFNPQFYFELCIVSFPLVGVHFSVRVSVSSSYSSSSSFTFRR